MFLRHHYKAQRLALAKFQKKFWSAIDISSLKKHREPACLTPFYFLQTKLTVVPKNILSSNIANIYLFTLH